VDASKDKKEAPKTIPNAIHRLDSFFENNQILHFYFTHVKDFFGLSPGMGGISGTVAESGVIVLR
jgi:hypothetical protein